MDDFGEKTGGALSEGCRTEVTWDDACVLESKAGLGDSRVAQTPTSEMNPAG